MRTAARGLGFAISFRELGMTLASWGARISMSRVLVYDTVGGVLVYDAGLACKSGNSNAYAIAATLTAKSGISGYRN